MTIRALDIEPGTAIQIDNSSLLVLQVDRQEATTGSTVRGHNGRYWDGVGIRVVKVFPGDQLLTEVVLQDVDVVYSCSVDPEYVFVRELYTEYKVQDYAVFGEDPSDYQLAIVRLYNGRPVAAVLSSRREGVKVLQTTIFSGMMRARVR